MNANQHELKAGMARIPELYYRRGNEAQTGEKWSLLMSAATALAGVENIRDPMMKGRTSAAKILDCGGKAQRRHRFSASYAHAKAAWRFASRRSPKFVVAAQAALGPSVVENRT